MDFICINNTSLGVEVEPLVLESPEEVIVEVCLEGSDLRGGGVPGDSHHSTPWPDLPG